LPDLVSDEDPLPFDAPIVTYRFVVHLYSSQRRSLDFQACIETIMVASCTALILSIDIVNGDRADVSPEDNIAFWRSLIVQGLVILLIGGHPCNSWSAARHNQEAVRHSENGRERPRPIRLADVPWGIDTPTSYERRNLDEGNLLLRAQALLMWECFHMGVPAMREHPADPWWLPSTVAAST